MTSRPGPAIPETVQHRGSGGLLRAQAHRRPSASGGHGRDGRDGRPVKQEPLDPADDAVNRPRAHAAGSVAAANANPPAAAKPRPMVLEHIHTSIDPARPPPRGKPHLFFNSAHGAPPPAANASMNLPVPPRPGVARRGDALQQQRLVPGGSGVKGSPAVKPPSTEPPPAAVVFPAAKTVDLFPWTGSNPEDNLSETLIKAGVSNKPQIMNETNTARPALWPNLKGKHGLPALSLLFVGVLEKRQSCGRITTPNSFKPPPRLTLRDSTREAWLHDLANPAVGLKRLSRTIPHGITGKALLDQCLNKRIPLPRAVWLAKCVGINEMRSHQRKGQAGTMTWIRGWTSSVEQFLDATIAAMGQQDWKLRITYALQLATSLFRERLLEEEHFLDWVLKSLDSCAQERLFLWLLVASLYGPDLTASRRRGRRLAESLLNHALQLYAADDDESMSPLQEYLEKILVKLLITSPESLLLPKTWDKHVSTIRRLSTRYPNSSISTTLTALDERCDRLSQTAHHNRASPTDSTRELLNLFDTIDFSQSVNIEKFAVECMSVLPDARQRILAAFEWACSIYRQGCHRIYFVTRLLRKWNQLGADIDDGILSYLQSTVSRHSQEPRNAFRIVAELVRSKTFSIGKYLQWLIATGLISGTKDASQKPNWPLRVITEIPLTGLSEQVRNLRTTLLRGTVHATEGEEDKLDEAENTVRMQLPSLVNTSVEGEPSVEVDLSGLSSTNKLELAIILRSMVLSSVAIVDHVPTKDPAVDETGPVCAISSQDYNLIRTYLEEFGDLAILADVIGVTCTSLDANVLASAADTLNYNHKAFRAIGAFEPLLQKIAMRYAGIRTVRFPERELLLSLLDLVHTAKVEGHLTQALLYDLSRHDQRTSVAACSPVSDTMTDVLYTTPGDTDEEIDRILSSGTSMDRQIMSRLFAKIMLNLEDYIKRSALPSGIHATWFYRLRNFDETSFDSIVADWLPSVIANRQAKMLHASLPPLVSSGCTTLSQFYTISSGFLKRRDGSDAEDAYRTCIIMLDILLPSERPSSLCQPQEAYKFRLEQQKFCLGSRSNTLGLIKEALDAGSKTPNAGTRAQFNGFLSSNRLRTMIRHCVLEDGHMLSTQLGIGAQSTDHAVHVSLKSLLNGLLDPSNKLDLNNSSPAQQISILVNCADHLSLPFCQLELQELFGSDTTEEVTPSDSLSGALLEAIKLAVERDDSSWVPLVTSLEESLVDKIREHAERELLTASAFLSNTRLTQLGARDKDDEAFTRRYLTVIDVTASSLGSENQTSIFMALVERFKGVLDTLNKSPEQLEGIAYFQALRQSIPILCTWLNALLRLAVVHGSVSLHKAPNQHQAALMWSLRLLMTHPALESNSVITARIYDAAIYLSDFIADDVRSHLAKMDAAKPTDDARCAFLFRINHHHDGWLALARPVPVSTTPQTQHTSSPKPSTSQPQQAASQSQAQNLGGNPLQRSLSPQQLQQLQSHAQNQNRMYQQHAQQPPTQQQRLLAQFQRLPPGQGSQQSQLQQMQQMQQMQSLAQQRNMQSSPVQLRRQQSQQQTAQSGKAAAPSVKAEKTEMKTYPYQLKWWEMLPEGGGNPNGNETAISLSLFGARKV